MPELIFLDAQPAQPNTHDGAPRVAFVTLGCKVNQSDTQKAIADFRAAGFRVVVVSNQAGIARGAMTEADLLEIHRRMVGETTLAGGSIDAIYYCPHHWEEGCECRKPAPGMLFQAQRDFSLDLSRTLFIGDDVRDAQAARAAGSPFELVGEGKSLLDIIRAITTEGKNS